MTMNNQILIIDDDADYCQLISEVMSDEFNCVLAFTGKEGLDRFENTCDPILVIVDLNLPDMTGFDICTRLQEYRNERDFAVFMISGDEDLSIRLRSFELGADDFIAKPFELHELKSRISRTIEYVDRQKILKDVKREGLETRKMANIAMAQASQYSYVMNFFKSLNHCQNPQQIALLFYEAMTFFKLHASIKLTLKDEHYFDSNLGDISPIEKSIYDVLMDHGRIYEFGKRTIINGRNVAFLIKNFPQDEHEAGQARDFLAALIEGIEAKVDELEVQNAIVEATKHLGSAIAAINDNLTKHNIAVNEVMSGMIVEISSSYHQLDLTDDQESFFTNMVEKGSQKMQSAENLLKSIQYELKEIHTKMESINTISQKQGDSGIDPTDTIDLF